MSNNSFPSATPSCSQTENFKQIIDNIKFNTNKFSNCLPLNDNQIKSFVSPAPNAVDKISNLV